MRISCDPKHPDFRPDFYRAEVYLNGKQLWKCLHADSDRGTATVHKVDKAGNPRYRDGEVMTEIRRGNICIFIPQ